MRTLQLAPYLDQRAGWPATGHHILAQYDDDTVVVYQAYRPSIGSAAVAAQRFGGGGFSLSRMSWIKPNFLWMMYRCGWATKKDQEVVLAIRIRRPGFEEILSQAVHSAFDPLYGSQEQWKKAVATSPVRLQWDPDHHPSGAKQERRAIQLGLEGTALQKYVEEWTISIEDISPFVAEQRAHVERKEWDLLRTPREEVYPVADPEVGRRLGI